jgi:hypothetical protein
MKRKLIYIVVLLLACIACEEIYNPDIDSVDNVLVVEAILRADDDSNTIYLYKTLNYNTDEVTYPSVSGATVYLTDDEGTKIDCPESSSGEYVLTGALDDDRSYQLNIELDGEVYISDAQSVPGVPYIDSVYGENAYDVSVDGTANNSSDIVSTYGIQTYADLSYRGDPTYYRFYGRKVIEYTDTYDTIDAVTGMPFSEYIYIWKSYYPDDAFNVAGPAEYSTEKDISKHELEFFEDDYTDYLPDTLTFEGWIYIIEAYGINEDTYNYYQDMISQLEAEGKIFDPIYTQLEGNIKCTSNEDITVLGNFEVHSYNEYRYYLRYSRHHSSFRLEKIEEEDFYDIALKGYIKADKPEFWYW